MSRQRWLVVVAGLATFATVDPQAQTIPAARVAILQAEARGAPDARDLATLRAGIRNRDSETARAAIRALGRLGRPGLVADIAVALRSSLPELRAEAAEAIAEALSGPTPSVVVAGGRAQPAGRPATPSTATNVASGLSTLVSRLAVEAEPAVRAAICEALGRIPYTDAAQIVRAEAALLGAPHDEFVTDRLGVAKGFEAIVRVNSGRWVPSPSTITLLRQLLGVPDSLTDTTQGAEVRLTALNPAIPLRDARIRRLALEALVTAGEIDSVVIERAAADPDPQVRWLAMRAVSSPAGSRAVAATAALRMGRTDPDPIVRMEALRAENAREKGTLETCRLLLGALHDSNTQVVLVVLDLLGDCGTSADAVGFLEHVVNDLSAADAPRAWHRSAHALVALSHAAPASASAALGQFTVAPISHLREYAARAAVVLNDRETLEKLASDPDGRVSRIASAGLGRLAPPSEIGPDATAQWSDINAADLQRFAAPRARVTIRDVGAFEVALFTAEAPASVLRFARLAQAGRYNGTSIVGLEPVLVGLIPRTDPGTPLRRETGSWPHVRGAMGLSPGGSETGGAELFIDLVDNPRFDHKYPVFAQVLNGIDVLDQILEADIIERIEIVTGP